ncbi:hypothetical protein B0O99DRAFT_701449 [Bisporella sp. PMI_857]|nr:hypothetical protein B0O99DRAFT_701449 [Bisporella sp. PMI_857]
MSLAVAVCTLETPMTAMAPVFMAVTMVGYNEAIMLPIAATAIRGQNEIRTAAGLASSIRSAISTVASTVYIVALTARLTHTIPIEVPAAIIQVGLPLSSVVNYMTVIAGGGIPGAVAAVPGLTSEIMAIGGNAYQTIFLTSIAFGPLPISCNIFVPNIDHLMNDAVAVNLTSRTGDRVKSREESSCL